MAVISGTLLDFSLDALAPYSPRLIFTPSRPSTSGGKLLSTKPFMVGVASDGSWSVDVQATDTLLPPAYYTVRIEWLDSDGGFVGVDILDEPLFVPNSGGQINDLIDASPGSSLIWVGLVPPPNPKPGQQWAEINPSNPNDPANTGELREWSA